MRELPAIKAGPLLNGGFKYNAIKRKKRNS